MLERHSFCGSKLKFAQLDLPSYHGKLLVYVREGWIFPILKIKIFNKYFLNTINLLINYLLVSQKIISMYLSHKTWTNRLAGYKSLEQDLWFTVGVGLHKTCKEEQLVYKHSHQVAVYHRVWFPQQQIYRNLNENFILQTRHTSIKINYYAGYFHIGCIWHKEMTLLTPSKATGREIFFSMSLTRRSPSISAWK